MSPGKGGESWRFSVSPVTAGVVGESSAVQVSAGLPSTVLQSWAA